MTAVVLDIEGTVSPKTVVYDTLFPYARARLADWVTRPEAADVVAEVRATEGPLSLDAVAKVLQDWSDADVKAGPLKTLQGLIWSEGFAAGQLRAELYPDVLPALEVWRAAGITLAVYSSGSVLAQRLWFGHTSSGDVTGLFTAFYDTRNAGPKKDPRSYATIAASLATPPPEIVFFSDSLAELDAARTSGWHTVGVSRPADGNPDVGDHHRITEFTPALIA